MLNLGGRFAETIRSRFSRNYLVLASVIISVLAYHYVVQFYAPGNNFISQVWHGLVNESYTFYSGSKGGFYINIGQHLEKETRRGAGIVVNNKETSGGFENAIRVMNSSSSFGLVQEDTIRDGDFIKKNIQYITPLYLERMHILYRTDLFQNVPGLGKAVISPNSPRTRNFFEDENIAISTGPSGSGSRIFASYVLAESGIQSVTDRGLSFNEALARLASNTRDEKDGKQLGVVFSIAGAPLPNVEELLKNDNIGLMSIDPILCQTLNNKYGLKLRPTTFRDKYEDWGHITTIGSYAFLIASRDVPKSAIMELLGLLDRTKHKMEGHSQKARFPLDQFDFKEAFARDYEGFVMELVRNFFVFTASIVVAAAFTLAFLVWLVSEFKQVQYFTKITEIYKDCLPENTNLDECSAPYPKPIIYDNQAEIISSLVRGLSRLTHIAQRIRTDYESGGITMTHHRYLLDNLYSIRRIFQRNLAQRFNEVIEDGEAIAPKDLRHYYTAGYLTREQYRDLRGQAA